MFLRNLLLPSTLQMLWLILSYYPITYPAGLIKPTKDLSEIFGTVDLPL